MKLINEASDDELFSKELSKIQEAIIKLEKIVSKQERPLRSHVTAVQVIAEDVEKLLKAMKNA